MAIAAASAGHFLPDNTEEPLLRHFGVNARFLVAIPLLIFGEPVLQTLTPASWSAHDLLWAGDDPTGRPDLRFAAWWYSFVARPVFYALVLQAFAPAAFALASVLAAHWGPQRPLPRRRPAGVSMAGRGVRDRRRRRPPLDPRRDAPRRSPPHRPRAGAHG